jgi:L-iditol 2-dehydrogenase
MEVCQNQTSVGYQYDGGFAEYMIVPEQVLKVDGLNRIPDNVGYDEASAAEPFACAINAQEQLGIEEGDFVVVFGAGPIGACTSGSPAASTRSAPSCWSTSTPSG